MAKILRKYFPVCFISSDKLLIFKKNSFSIFDINSLKINKLTKIRFTFGQYLIYLVPLLSRILRMGIRCSIKISENVILFVFKNTLYELDLADKEISNGISFKGSRPLMFSKIIGISGFDDGIYFGEYLTNPSKKPVSIYKRVSTDNWCKVFEFEEGTIEHIHNIVADNYNDKVFIFTGDFENSAGIWLATNNFKSVVPILRGEQKYRACVAFPTQEGLIYATDSPFTTNSIRILFKDDNNHWISNQIKSINGSSIYGCIWNGLFVFSTTVEGDGRNQSIFYKFFGRKRGDGIIHDSSFIYIGSPSEGFRCIYKVKKDFLPFFFFQFGVLIFPSEENNSNVLPIYHIATSKNSMNTLLYRND